MNLLLFVGAGASVELGVPTMRPMAEAFLLHLCDLSWPREDYSLVEDMLADESNDMEHLIDRIDRLRHGMQEQQAIGMTIDEEFVRKLHSISREAEWFVQHTCEKVQRVRAETVWSPTFANLAENSLCVVTSNYDRAIEIGARAAGVALNDGFDSAPHAEVAEWRDFTTSAPVLLLKVHGSTDWYQASTGVPIKLKHPIPLFGDFELRRGSNPALVLRAALVLPSREKRITTPPYPSISASFHHRARTADAAVFVGTSLRDPHLRSVFDECARRIPTALVGRSSAPQIHEKAIHIAQSSSYFLSSTLPRLLSDPLRFCENLNAERDNTWTGSVIDDLLLAKDVTQPEGFRCTAIERLLKAKFSMEASVLRGLLNDSSSAIRRFALALVPTSFGDEKLIAFAEQTAADNQDADFADEIRVLKELVSVRADYVEK